MPENELRLEWDEKIRRAFLLSQSGQVLFDTEQTWKEIGKARRRSPRLAPPWGLHKMEVDAGTSSFRTIGCGHTMQHAGGPVALD